MHLSTRPELQLSLRIVPRPTQKGETVHDGRLGKCVVRRRTRRGDWVTGAMRSKTDKCPYLPDSVVLGLSLISAIGILTGGLLTYPKVASSSLSVQASLTTLSTLLLFVGLGYCFVQKPRLLLGLALTAGLILVVFALIAVASGRGARSVSYLVVLSAFTALVIGGYSRSSRTDVYRLLFGASIGLAVLSPFMVTLLKLPDVRVLQISIPLTLSLGLLIDKLGLIPQGFSRALPIAAGVAALAVVLPGARMATLALGFVSLAGFLLNRGWNRILWALALLVQAALLVYILTASSVTQRWYISDPEGIAVGGINVNTNGRSTVVAQAVDELSPDESSSQDFLRELLVGGGPGSASNLAQSVVGSSVPMNEYLRIFVDFGALGVLGLVALAATAFIRITASTPTESRRGVLAASSLTLVVLAAAALTENVLSYSWLLIPIGLLATRTKAIR